MEPQSKGPMSAGSLTLMRYGWRARKDSNPQIVRLEFGCLIQFGYGRGMPVTPFRRHSTKSASGPRYRRGCQVCPFASKARSCTARPHSRNPFLRHPLRLLMAPGATRMPAAGRPAAHHPRCSWLAGLQDPVPAGLLLPSSDAARNSVHTVTRIKPRYGRHLNEPHHLIAPVFPGCHRPNCSTRISRASERRRADADCPDYQATG